MPIIYRLARADELQRAEELVVRSINDLTERHGFGPMATLRPPDFQLFSLKDDPDGLWVADADEEIVGFALSWVCGDLWFLAELFVAPDQQGRGVGNELLARTFEHADAPGPSLVLPDGPPERLRLPNHLQTVHFPNHGLGRSVVLSLYPLSQPRDERRAEHTRGWRRSADGGFGWSVEPR